MSDCMNKWFFVVAFTCFSISATVAQETSITIDNTCKTCTRKENDSTNVYHRRALRVNQVGFLPDQNRKTAFAAVSGGGTYQVIAADGREVFTGGLQYLGNYTRPQMVAKGYANSLTLDYSFESATATKEDLYLADFSGLKDPGRYRVVSGQDTSASFVIHNGVYGEVLEKVLFVFGASRCGPTHSWMHEACHLKDGSHLGAAYAGRLTGGWHDCGAHGKYSQTQAYTALVLSLAYSIWPDRSPDNYGKSYAETSPDGIPDILAEAKVGVDFIYKLYAVSKELGLIDSSDMLHSVGMGPGMDHQYWDLPERQDQVAQGAGGPDRPVSKRIGSNVAGSYAASLAFLAAALKSREPAYSAQLEQAAIDIYDGIVAKKPGTTTTMPCCYTGGIPTRDDEAMAALALWYATGISRFGADLMKAMSVKPFHQGGWPTDYENAYSYVLYGFTKLILRDQQTAFKYGISSQARDSLLAYTQATLKESIRVSSNGSDLTQFPGINVDKPYHGVFTSTDWGFNRYNMGVVL
jgi:Glycosyl hydrolase family 9/Cellulase N-terminal ig-like domain